MLNCMESKQKSYYTIVMYAMINFNYQFDTSYFQTNLDNSTTLVKSSWCGPCIDVFDIQLLVVTSTL